MTVWRLKSIQSNLQARCAGVSLKLILSLSLCVALWTMGQTVQAQGPSVVPAGLMANPTEPGSPRVVPAASVPQPELFVLTEGQAWLLKNWVPRRPVSLPEDAPTSVITAESSAATEIRVLLEPLSFTTLSSPMDGRIVRVATSIGEKFDAGTALVRFDCEEQRARLSMSRTELRASIEKYDSKLLMKGLDQASEIEVQLAALEVEKNKSQVNMFDFQVRQCTVAAPWVGATAKLHVRSHMSVNKGAPLLDLVKAGPLKARMNLPSRWMSKIRVGTPIKIEVDETSKTYKAKISAVNARVDAVSQTIEVEATLDIESKELLPGMSGVVQFDGVR